MRFVKGSYPRCPPRHQAAGWWARFELSSGRIRQAPGSRPQRQRVIVRQLAALQHTCQAELPLPHKLTLCRQAGREVGGGQQARQVAQGVIMAAI